MEMKGIYFCIGFIILFLWVRSWFKFIKPGETERQKHERALQMLKMAMLKFEKYKGTPENLKQMQTHFNKVVQRVDKSYKVRIEWVDGGPVFNCWLIIERK